MMKQVFNSQTGPRAARARKLLVRGACGAVLTGMVFTSLADVSQAHAPIPVEVLVGLRQGAVGEDVKAVQQALIAAGVPVPGGADGNFGPATRAALVDFQGRKGLAQSGEVDAATASALGLTTSDSGSTPAPTAVNGLQQGASGEAVKELQQKLAAAGAYVLGGADGQFGSATKRAVSQYQSWNGLVVSGVVDAATASRLGLTGAASALDPEPPVTSASNPYVGLAQGATGDLVKQLQSGLIKAGVNVPGGADGIFGSVTKSALASYQQANGLTASGSVDAATAAKLGLGAAAPATSSSNPYVGLAVGAQGAMVKELQTALMATGITVRGGADGQFGNVTKSALQAFQSVNGIAQSGVVTEKGAGILKLGSPAPQSSGGGPTPVGFPTKGETSERVRVLQQALIDWGISVFGGADGSFGNATAAAISKFQQVHGLTVTGTVTQQTADKMGLAPASASAPPSSSGIVMKRFLVQGQCYYGNTWHAPRGNGRLHEGVDVIAAEGKLLYAVVDGTITKQYWDQPGALAGNGLRVGQANGTYFTYLHMSGFAPGIKVGTKVKAGDVVGFVGNTGSSSTPHVHFEIHPGGGGAVNPYPYIKAIDDCGNTTAQYQSSFAPA
jgi:peptidoglycan hydrolase-like protein with peptidoglycan-binding domain